MSLQEKIQTNNLALLNSFNTLNRAEVNFKSSENSWSILQCVEHVFLMAKAVLKVMETPGITGKAENESTELFGEQKLNKLLVVNRAFKVPAPDFVAPKGFFVDSSTAIQNMNNIIDKIADHISTNKIELETQTIKHPVLGDMTKLDWIHFMISHTNRHIIQIEEMKTSPGFASLTIKTD